VLGVAEPDEAVVEAVEVASTLLLELVGQPLPSVEANLDAEGKPGLDAGVDPAEDRVPVVLVE